VIRRKPFYYQCCDKLSAKVAGDMTKSRSNSRRITGVILILVWAAMTLTSGSSVAVAQGPGVDQYTPSGSAAGQQPRAGEPAGGGAGTTGTVAGADASQDARTKTSTTVPFTDYPATPLVISLLILLLSTAAVRLGFLVRSRLAQR